MGDIPSSRLSGDPVDIDPRCTRRCLYLHPSASPPTLKKEYFEDDIGSMLATTIGVDEGGYWKLRISREVIDPNAHASEGQTVVGHKMIYQFYQPKIGKRPGPVPTRWVMGLHTIIHENDQIAPAGTNKLGDHIVLCKIYNRDNVKRWSAQVRTRKISAETPGAANEQNESSKR